MLFDHRHAVSHLKGKGWQVFGDGGTVASVAVTQGVLFPAADGFAEVGSGMFRGVAGADDA